MTLTEENMGKDGLKRKLKALSGALLLGGSVLIIGAKPAAAADTIVVQWNDVSLQNIRDTHPGPPIVARMLAIVDTCMYDAWTAYDHVAVPTQASGIARRPASESTDANKLKAISYAAYRAEIDLFPTDTANTNALMTMLGFDPTDTSTDTSTPTGIGNVACAAVLNFRHHDGANQLADLHPGAYSDYTGYAPVNTPDVINDPNRWQPLRVSDGKGGFVIQTYIAPFWGQVTPFAASLPIFKGDGPASYPGEGYTDQVDKILKYSANLTDTQKVIAEYWKDGPKSELPPGHWSLFAEYVSRRDSHGIDDDVKMFFAESNGIFDASIASWGIKRQYDFVRPVTAVHFLKAGQMVLAWGGPFQGTQLIPAESWVPYQPATIVTPPFAEYISGHSIFSAAGAQILKRFTGNDSFGDSVVIPAGSSSVEPGLTPHTDVTLSWATFKDAADQAGLSRRYGGIHFVQGDLDGREYGRAIGKRDWKVAQTYFNGSSDHNPPPDGDD